MARDMASSFNHLYGEHLVLPEAIIEASVATLPGLDGRKMSKSYDNTIPLFAPQDKLRSLIGGLLTDSRAPGEPKNPDGSALFQIYQAFASEDETAALRHAYAEGIAWGDAKQLLFERVDREIAPMRQTYEELMRNPARVEALLRAGAERARSIATPFMATLRHAVGLRELAQPHVDKPARAVRAKSDLPSFKQYRERDGSFHFKLADAQGRALLQGTGFASPQDAAQAIAALRSGGASALPALRTKVGAAPGATEGEISEALQKLVQTGKE
ncbi:MAG: tryptophan--tRNA ligase, partial [Burkholderiaceae bacterium]|nr:tryptophan--tRNA ligase [Burkholderiaceae bacterium]